MGRDRDEVREPRSYLGGEHSRHKEKQEERINGEDAEGRLHPAPLVSTGTGLPVCTGDKGSL